MANELIPVIIIGGVAYTIAQPGAPLAVPAPSPGSYYPPNITKPTQPIAQTLKGGRVLASSGAYVPPNSPSGSGYNPYVGTGGGNWGGMQPADQTTAAALAELEEYIRSQYNAMSAEARKAGADKLNDLYGPGKHIPPLDPPLKGDETYEEVGQRVGYVTGASVGGAIGGPLGAKLGALLGAYLGGEIGEWLAENWDKVKGSFEGWDDLDSEFWQGTPAYNALTPAQKTEYLQAFTFAGRLGHGKWKTVAEYLAHPDRKN